MRNLLLLAPLALVALAACDLPMDPGARLPCRRAVPVSGQPASLVRDQYIVMYRDGTDARATTDRLAQRYGFVPSYVYEYVLGFSAELSADALDGVRCAPEVQSVTVSGYARPH